MSAVVTPPPLGNTAQPREPSVTGPHRMKWTRAEFLRLDELGFFGQHRVQLVFGEIYEMSPMGWPHSLSVGLVGDALRKVFATGHWVGEQRPFHAGESQPFPDVAVYPGTARSFTDHPETAVLLVEVADSSFEFDTTTKAELYATAGIPEYWVLDVNARRLHVFRDPAPLPAGLAATNYRSRTDIEATGTVSPLAAPSAVIAVADLLP
jgi:Uma2 family endonuclease